MKIAFAHNRWYYQNEEVWTYSKCMVRELKALGHDVIQVPKKRFENDEQYRRFDILMDIDSGRDETGAYDWHLTNHVPIPSVAFLIDSHGQSDIHSTIGCYADHVFFAVWNKRDLFSSHPSAHWAPNFTDLQHFNKPVTERSHEFDFGFFGSKNGLDRATPLIKICEAQNWTYDVAQVNRKGKHQWPHTCVRMTACRTLFNHGQKHDGPNLRVIESMACGRPLITDSDVKTGMGFLFEPWHDYIPYTAYTCEGLERAMQFSIKKPDACKKIAENAYQKVINNHLTKHRIAQIMEVVK